MTAALQFGLEGEATSEVKCVASHHTPSLHTVSSMNRQMWTVFNFLFTVVGSFIFGYFAAHFADMSTTAVRLVQFVSGTYCT